MSTVTEKRQVQDFSEVSLQGYGDIVIEQISDPARGEALEVEADKNVLPMICSEVRDGRLMLSLDAPWWNPAFWIDWLFMDKRLRYHVTMRQVSQISIRGSGSAKASGLQTERCRLRISGSGKFIIEGIQAGAITSEISGSGRVDLSGVTRQLEITIGGSGTVRASRLETQETRVHISGSGTAHVNVSQALDVSISGSGDVRYVGSPQVRQSISGSGRVRQVNET